MNLHHVTQLHLKWDCHVWKPFSKPVNPWAATEKLIRGHLYWAAACLCGNAQPSLQTSFINKRFHFETAFFLELKTIKTLVLVICVPNWKLKLVVKKKCFSQRKIKTSDNKGKKNSKDFVNFFILSPTPHPQPVVADVLVWVFVSAEWHSWCVLVCMCFYVSACLSVLCLFAMFVDSGSTFNYEIFIL